MKRPSDTFCHWGQTTQLRTCFCGTVQAGDRKLVANADLGRQTAEGSEPAHPSERHVRHSICLWIIGYIAETLWSGARRPKPKRPQSASSSWSKNAPETRRPRTPWTKKFCLPHYDVISFLLVRRRHAAKKNIQKPGRSAGPGWGRALAQRPVACRMRFSFDLCRDWILPVSLRFSQSQTHVKHPSVSKDKRKRELELERARQRKRAAYAKKKAELAEYKEALKDTSTAQKVMTVATAHSCKNFWNTNFENELIQFKKWRISSVASPLWIKVAGHHSQRFPSQMSCRTPRKACKSWTTLSKQASAHNVQSWP